MSELQVALKNIGVLEAMEARARELGTTLEEALRLLVTGTESVSVKPKPGTVEFYDAVCAYLTGNENASFNRLKAEVEEKYGCTLRNTCVYLYAMGEAPDISLAPARCLDEIEEAVNHVLGQ